MIPPSTTRSCPVTNPDSSLSRNSAASATASGYPGRLAQLVGVCHSIPGDGVADDRRACGVVRFPDSRRPADVVVLHRGPLDLGVVGETPPTAPDLSLRKRLHPSGVLELLRRPGVAFTTLVAVLAMYVFQSFVSFFPTFLREYHGLSQGEASFAFGVGFVVIAVGLPVVGTLADRYGTVAGLAVPFSLTAVGFTVLLLGSGSLLVYAGIVVVGAGVTWGGPLQSRLVGMFDASERGSGFGMARTVYVLLGSVGNVVTGTLAERRGWVVAYGVVVVLMVVGVGLVVGRRVVQPG
jgi:predicted MFS family arabinose efflux permease